MSAGLYSTHARMSSFARTIPALEGEPLQHEKLAIARCPQSGQLHWLLVALQAGITSSGRAACYGTALVSRQTSQVFMALVVSYKDGLKPRLRQAIRCQMEWLDPGP